jgi:hypothetical protein
MRDLSKLFSDVNPMLGSERSFRGYAIRFYTARISPQEFGSLTDADTWWEWFLGIRSPEALLNLASICVCQCTLVLGCLALLAILFRSEGYEERLVRVISSAWFRFYQLCFLAVVHELLSALYCGVSWLYYHPDYWSIFSGNLVLFVLGCLIGVVGWLVLTILGLCWTIFVRFVAVTAVEIAVLLPAAVCLPLHVVLCHVYGLLG